MSWVDGPHSPGRRCRRLAACPQVGDRRTRGDLLRIRPQFDQRRPTAFNRSAERRCRIPGWR